MNIATTARPSPTTAEARASRLSIRSLLIWLTTSLLLTGLAGSAIAQETCNSPNQTSDYILGRGDTSGLAMHWYSGLVWKRCPAGQTWNGSACTGPAKQRPWNHLVWEYLPKQFDALHQWWLPFSPPDEPIFLPPLSYLPPPSNRLLTGGWRMPYITELRDLSGNCAAGPAINRSVFPSVSSSWYLWSASPDYHESRNAWAMGANRGNIEVYERYYQDQTLSVRGGQPFRALTSSATRTLPHFSVELFGPFTLNASTSGSSNTAWGGARISGAGNPLFQVNSNGLWVREAIVKSGDTILVLLTSGDAGSSRTATLRLRSGETYGTNDLAHNAGTEHTKMRETTANFTLNVLDVYTLKYNAGTGGSLSGNTSQTVIEGGNGSTVTAVANANYQFTGWNDGVTTAARTDTNVQASINVNAQFVIKSYTVTFKDWNGTTLKTQTVNHGSAATAPANPGRSGYSFSGWDKSFSNVTGNLAVTAQYSINQYTVSFNSQGGSAVAPITQNFGTTVTVPPAPSRTGHVFSSWNTAANGNGTSRAPGSSFTMPAQNQILYGIWTINNYAVTASTTGNGSITPASQTADHGDSAYFTVTPDTNYNVGSLSGDTCTPTHVSDNDWVATNITAECTVTANFDINQYVVRFEDWDGTTLDTQNVDHGDTAAAPADPARTGYTFSAWDAPFNNINADLTVTAQYTINQYSVTASSSGDGNITPASQSVEYEAIAQVTVTPDSGHRLKNIQTDNCTPSDTGNGIWTAIITEDCHVSAEFEPVADVWIHPSTQATHLFPGERVVFALNVGNDGPEPATAALLTWVAPVSLLNPAWRCEAAAPAICPQQEGAGDLNLQLDLPVSGHLFFLVDAEVAAGSGGEISVSADIAPGLEHDPDLSNNQTDQILPISGIHRDGFE